jgi:hypothetical protein
VQPFPYDNDGRQPRDNFCPNEGDVIAEGSHNRTPGWTFRSAGKPKISEIELDSGSKFTFGPLLVALNTIASRLQAKPLINIIRKIETGITLSARLIFSPMPVTLDCFREKLFLRT